jgi:SPP1 gp7 family putative phage head morphogenesis protein
MSTALAVRPTWLARAWARMRAIAIASKPESASAGSDFGGDVASHPSMPAISQMSALGAFVWVYVATNLCSRDLASVPRKVIRGEGKRAKVIDDHPYIRLMRQPRVRVDGIRYERQAWADWYLCGNAYDLVLRPKGVDRPSGIPWSLQRLHPGRTTHLTEGDGDPRAFQFATGGQPINYDWEDVIWTGGISWEDDPRGSYGQGAIRALATVLNTDIAATKNEQRASRRGRPDFIVRPKDQEQNGKVVYWDAEQTKTIKDIFDRALSETSGGALVVGGAADVDPIGWSPRDTGTHEIHARVRDEILATFGIPPSKAGVPGVANYATAQIEDLSYWEARRSDATLRDEAHSRLARMLGDPDDHVIRDWSGIRAFQEDRTERQARARNFWLMGLPVKAALSAEGFEAEAGMVPEAEVEQADNSLNGGQVTSATAIVSAVALGQLPRGSGVAMLSVFFGLLPEQAEALMGEAGNGFEPKAIAPSAAPPSAGVGFVSSPAPAEEGPRSVRGADDEREQARAATWRAFEDDLRGPLEAMLATTTERFLTAQLGRYVARLGTRSVTGTTVRDVSASDIDDILAHNDEMRRLLESLGPDVETAIRKAFEVVAKRLGAQLKYQPSKVEALILEELGARVQGTTSDKVREILQAAIKQGKSVSDMAEDLRRGTFYTRERALLVARTETTRAVSAGTLLSYDSAAEAGVEIDAIEWLSSRDGAVRDEHEALDGQRVKRGDEFEVNGQRARGPGEFDDVAMNANCRCTTIPVLKE